AALVFKAASTNIGKSGARSMSSSTIRTCDQPCCMACRMAFSPMGPFPGGVWTGGAQSSNRTVTATPAFSSCGMVSARALSRCAQLTITASTRLSFAGTRLPGLHRFGFRDGFRRGHGFEQLEDLELVRVPLRDLDRHVTHLAAVEGAPAPGEGPQSELPDPH